MSKIHIVPKSQFDGILQTNDSVRENFNDIAFVSICEPEGDAPEIQSYFKEDSYNVLRVYTFDIEQDLPYMFDKGKRTEKVAKAFTDEQARVVVDFVERNKDKKLWLIHCTAGISRSGAVGAYVAERIGMDWFDLKLANRQIIPNTHILTTLRRVSGHTLRLSDATPT